MDRFINTPGYPLKLVKKYPLICAYNSLKEEYVSKVETDKLYRQKKFCLEPCKAPGFLKYSELFQDVDGKMKTLPKKVLDQIGEGICTVNVYPSQIRMCANGSKYQLYVKYTNDGIPDEEPLTVVQLDYHFGQNLSPKSSGYFSRNHLDDHRLPKYEVVGDMGGSKYLRVTYNEDDPLSSTILNLKLEVNGEADFHKVMCSKAFETGDYRREMEYFMRPATTLFSAILRRVFPSHCHLTKLLLNITVLNASRKFQQNMTLTALNWSSFNGNALIYVKYVLSCFSNNMASVMPRNCDIFPPDVTDALNIIIRKYPFFLPDEKSFRVDKCLLDLWEEYFETKLTAEVSKWMKLSKNAEANLLWSYSKNPGKYARICELFPSIVSPKMREDFEARLAQLRGVKKTEDAPFTPEDIIYFNRTHSTIPVQWRAFITGGTLNDPIHETGGNILAKRMSCDPAADDVIMRINYIDIENYGNPLSLVELMNKISIPGNVNVEKLDPTDLEAKFASYSFSPDYKTTPTGDDCLAVRFAIVYKDEGYRVPKVPEDFFDRFNNSFLEKSIANNQEIEDWNACVICMKGRKNYLMPTCGHVAVCELCSFRILKCPLCYKPGNPVKIYF